MTGMRGVSSHFSPILIRASTGWVSLSLGDLWDYRGLVYFLAWRDLKIRYKQTVLGVAWGRSSTIISDTAFSIFSASSAAFRLTEFPIRCLFSAAFFRGNFSLAR